MSDPSKPVPPPDIINFPAQLLEQWVAIPQAERVEAHLTRQDLDHLLFGLLRSNDAQAFLRDALVSWSQGDLAAANRSLSDFLRTNIESTNNYRQFFTALMAGALQVRNAKR